MKSYNRSLVGVIMAVSAVAVAGATGGASVARPAPHLGQFARQADIGKNRFKGSATYNAKTGTYRVTGSGDDIWGGNDQFHFVSKPASGDLTIAATVAFTRAEGDAHKKAGVMIRQSLAPDAPYADIMVHGNGHIDFQYRESPGAETREIGFDDAGVSRFRLERLGDYVYMSAADAKGVFHPVGGGFKLKLTGAYLVGLAVCAHSQMVTEAADFSQVEIARPEPFTPKTTGYDAKVESTLETIDVATTYQRVIYHTADHIEAPNWSPDGKTFYFNSGGHIFTLPATGGTPTQLDTGDLARINNDHGLSADGQWLAVSDQTRVGDNASRVYILPAQGGAPRQVTAVGPSYWHGWSPDGKTLAVIGQRKGEFDVYAIPAAGGAETRLTTAPGLDDGSDYSPDGQWIYFNSVRSGNMKIWRMHPDGSQQEQMSFGDDSRDWFPHPSPDGKWIAYVSFGTEVTVGDHPPNHDVMLKIMPAGGGEARVIAKLFGGQGTMNVPSWSPDSTHVAFVSYHLVP